MKKNPLYPKIDSKLAHLSEKEINELHKLYYEKTNKELIADYNIDATSNTLRSIIPPKICKDVFCKYCEIPMWETLGSKYFPEDREIFCPECNHKHNSDRCTCFNCEIIRENEKLEEEKKLRTRIEYFLGNEGVSPVDYSDITLEEKIYLASLLRTGLSEDLNIISLNKNIYSPLTPSYKFTIEIIDSLLERGIIIININSPLDCFCILQDHSISFYHDKVQYLLNINYHKPYAELVNDLMNLTIDAEQNTLFLFQLWKRLAIEECIEYLLYNMQSVNFNFSPGKKTIQVFSDLLQHFSTSQIFYLIYNNVTRATRYSRESSTPVYQAANSVIGNCQRLGETALSQGWEPTKYKRWKSNPQSEISKLLFNRIMKIDHEGFDHKPILDFHKLQKTKQQNPEEENPPQENS